jgi:hypothetical protein
MVLAGLVAIVAGEVRATQPSFELDLKELDAARKNAAKPVPRPVKAVPAPKLSTPAKAAPAAEAGTLQACTVKPGDNIFKILMRDFRLSNAEAERLIPEIVRLNRLQDIRRLTVGQTLLIPTSSAARSVVPVAVKQRPADNDSVPERQRPAAAQVPADPSQSGAAEPSGQRSVAPEAQLEPVTSTADAPEMTVAAHPPPAMVPVGTVLAVAVNGGDPLGIFLRLAEVLQIRILPNQVIESRGEKAEAFSIKVPLYGEGLGKRLIVAGGGQDPFQYTLFRLLEGEGYGVLQFREGDRFREVTAATLVKLDVPFKYGRYRLVNGKEQEVLGYLIATPRGKILLTDAPVDGVWTALEVEGE